MFDSMHPIDQLFLPQVRTASTSLQSNNYKSETHDIIQRQRVIKSFLYRPDENEPSIRKPKTLSSIPKGLSITSIPSPQFLFAEINEQSSANTNNNRQTTTKKDLDSSSPPLTRRQRPTIENPSPNQQMSDITNLSTALPSHFTFRPAPRTSRNNHPSFKIEQRISSPRIRPLNSSKTTNEHLFKPDLSIPKLSQAFNFPSVHHRRPESNSLHSRTLATVLRAKSQLTKYSQQQSATRKTPQPSFIQDLYISPRVLNYPSNNEDMNRKHSSTSLWSDLKINVELTSDDSDDFLSTDGNSSTSTCNSDPSKLQIPSSSVKRASPKRRPYNLILPPVAEDLDDDEQTGDESI